MTHPDPKVQALLNAIDKAAKTHCIPLIISNARKALEPAPPKPREVWISVAGGCYTTLQNAKYNVEAGCHHLITHYREVIPGEKPIVWMPEPDDLPWEASDGFKTVDGQWLYKNHYIRLRKYLMETKP